MRLALMLYSGMGSPFGFDSDLLSVLAASYLREEVKRNYTIQLRNCLEKGIDCIPKTIPNRRDLLRKSQARHGYCQATRIPIQNRNKTSKKRQHHSRKYYT
jgi:hypothetical protein